MGTGVNTCGLYHTPLGIRYYEYLLAYSVGTDLSVGEIHRLLEEQMESDYETILCALRQDAGLAGAGEEGPSEEAPEAILKRLEGRIQGDFPAAEDISWQVKEVPESLSAYLSPAFYMTPAMDAPQQNVIYINPSRRPDRTARPSSAVVSPLALTSRSVHSVSPSALARRKEPARARNASWLSSSPSST